MKECSKCKQNLSYDKFYKDKTSSDGYDRWCKKCRKEYYQSYKENKMDLDKFRRMEKYAHIQSLKTPCLKCGESRPYIIQFHHIIPSEKRIGHNLANYSTSVIDEEIDKCVCLCANCHIEFHHLYGVHPSNPIEALDDYLKGKPDGN